MTVPASLSVTPQTTAIPAGSTVQFQAVTSDTAAVTWSATAGSIDAQGNYTAPSGQGTTVTITATSTTDPTRSASGRVYVVAPGQVSATANPQVALYSIAPPATGKVSVQFGLDTNYRLTTWAQPVPLSGQIAGTVNLFVAGMKANSPYHMRAVVRFSDGTQFLDADHTFVTGASAANAPAITITTTPGMAPQSGVELLDLINVQSLAPQLVVTDLGGNVLWSYEPGLGIPDPIKLLPNGHFLINFDGAGADGTASVLQEVDLTGAVVWQMTAADLNAALATATCAGCNISVVGTHHDFAVLPNGHLILIASTVRTIAGSEVLGDVLIDLDRLRRPVWLWNEFDHLDVNRHPMLFPDWTHTNAVIYSADDGNLIVSIRHQNWLVKVDYENGAGSGNILWKLGYQGDFTLVGGTDPTDWFYAEHGPSFTTSNTTGTFSLALFDNGNDRVFPSGVTCGTAGAPPCLYSTVPILRLDENARTATLTFHPTAPAFSIFGGNAELLNNGDVEYCEASGGPGFAGDVYEVTPGNQMVWKLQIVEQFAYRGQRLPSLYPGVQW